MSAYAHEQEVLINDGCCFQVESVEDSNFHGKPFIKITVKAHDP